MNSEETTTPMARAAQSVGDGAAQAWASTKEKTGELFQGGERIIRENPGVTALSACGIGLALGILVGWVVAREEHNQYCWCTSNLLRRLGHKLKLD